ncbi:MAG: hypothetical protein HY702_07120, partial [Gemmatimonadetes bacterium]|nr:hypothetical protein [Gemmatimonadota bacterium]
RYRRILGVGLVVSTAAHAAILAFGWLSLPTFGRDTSARPLARMEREAPAFQRPLQVVAIREESVARGAGPAGASLAARAARTPEAPGMVAVSHPTAAASEIFAPAVLEMRIAHEAPPVIFASAAVQPLPPLTPATGRDRGSEAEGEGGSRRRGGGGPVIRVGIGGGPGDCDTPFGVLASRVRVLRSGGGFDVVSRSGSGRGRLVFRLGR